MLLGVLVKSLTSGIIRHNLGGQKSQQGWFPPLLRYQEGDRKQREESTKLNLSASYLPSSSSFPILDTTASSSQSPRLDSDVRFHSSPSLPTTILHILPPSCQYILNLSVPTTLALCCSALPIFSGPDQWSSFPDQMGSLSLVFLQRHLPIAVSVFLEIYESDLYQNPSVPPPLAITTCRKTSQLLRVVCDAFLSWPRFPWPPVMGIWLILNCYLEAYTTLQPKHMLTTQMELSLVPFCPTCEHLFTLWKTIQVSMSRGLLSKLYHILEILHNC